MKKIIASAFASLLIFSNAYSMDFSVGVSATSAVFHGKGTERNNNENGTATVVTTENGIFGDTFVSLFAEVAPNDIFALGIDYVPEAIETPENTNIQGAVGTTKTNKVSADFEDLTTVYAKVNVPLGGLYLKVGYSTVDVITTESLATSSTYGNVSTEGPMVGLGYQHDTQSSGISLRAEISAHQFDDVTANNGVAATGNRNVIDVEDMIGARGTISIVKTF